MRLLGVTSIGAGPVVVAPDTKQVARFDYQGDGRIAKVSIYLDGNAPGVTTSGVVRAVAYSPSTSALLWVSRDVTVTPGQAAGWVDFLPREGEEWTFESGLIDVGVHVAPGTPLRVWSTQGGGRTGRWNADPFSDGPAATFGTSTTLDRDLAIYASYFKPWTPPAEDDFYLAALPWAESQRVFSLGGPDAQTRRTGRIGWYGSLLDPEQGANAIVRQGGPFDDYLGERLRITSRTGLLQRVVYVYCHDRSGEVEDDVDVVIPRGAFSRIGLLAADRISAVVEVMK